MPDVGQVSERCKSMSGGGSSPGVNPHCVHINSGNVLSSLRAIVERGAAGPSAIYRFADGCRANGQFDSWRAAVALALDLPHSTPQDIYYRARVKLTLGDWSGWTDYEARHDKPGAWSGVTPWARWRSWSTFEWNGREGLRDLTLMVVGEKGFGDVLQMLRFIPPLVEQARHVIVYVDHQLVNFVQFNLGPTVLVTTHDADHTANVDRYVWSMSLPAFAGDLPPFRPLVAPSPLGIREDGDGAFRIGLCWAGNPRHSADAQRSMPLAALRPLTERGDIECVSLQLGQRMNDAAMFPKIVQFNTLLQSFAETADLVTGLDAVVTVDTAVAHLAGGLGVPTYLLLPYAADWRWGLEDRTPWYPTMQLVRQRTPNGWNEVVTTLVRRLETQVLAGNANADRPPSLA